VLQKSTDITDLPMSYDNPRSNDINGNQQRVYNEDERSAIDVFKEKYLEATTSAGRKSIAQLHIFPALFNHWKSKGRVFNDEDIQMKSNVSITCLYFLIHITPIRIF
jgi:hypothetical protein